MKCDMAKSRLQQEVALSEVPENRRKTKSKLCNSFATRDEVILKVQTCYTIYNPEVDYE